MTRKNKYKKPNHNTNKTEQPTTEEDQQILMAQCLELYQLIDNNTKLLKQQQQCHLLSKKWLNNWKAYTGYQAIGKEQGKIPKGVGKKHPGKINEGLTKSNNGYLEIPTTLPQYQYLNIVLNDKLDKDEDYIPVTNKLWDMLLERYEVVVDIIRPIRQMKNSYFYDSQLISIEIIVLDYEVIDQHLSRYNNKISKKDRAILFDSYKIQLSTIWEIQDLQKFFQKLISHLYKQKKQIDVRIWRAFFYLSLGELQEQLATTIETNKYQIQGRPLEGDKYQDLDIDEIVKDTYTLVIECQERRLTGGGLPQKIKGYCQDCLKVKPLIEYCMCEQYHYCGTECRITDQVFHSKCCSVAFDSEDDEEYESKKIQTTEQFKGCGLDNLGNTCYMNSTLQCLASISQVRQFYGESRFKGQVENDKTKMNMKMSKFMKLLESDKSISPWGLKGQINYYLPPFRGFKQHDANDFLTNLVNALNETLIHPDHLYHQLYQHTFMGVYDSIIQCPDCSIQIKSTQIFMQVSVPIKERTKRVFYNYAVVKQKQIIKGKTQLQQTWNKLKQSMKVSEECIIYGGKESEDLYDINEQNEVEREIKSLKGRQVIAYPYIKYNEGDKLFEFSTIFNKNICGTQMKSKYGYPHLIVVDPRITTMIGFWIKIAQYFYLKQLADNLASIQKQYFQLMQNKETEQTNTQPTQQIVENQIKQNIKQSLEQIVKKSNVVIQLHDLRRHKGVCSFCKKKCDGCQMGIIAGQSVEEYFDNKIDEVRFSIQLPSRFQMAITHLNPPNTGQPNLQDCLELFKQPEQLDQENAWYCQACDMMRLAIKQMTIKQYPKVFIIQFNRFKTHNDKKVKNTQPINYNEVQQFGGKPYRLIGVIIHEGSIDGGHYWAISYRCNKYYIFNDEKVSETDKIINKNAYILFYKQI